MSKYQEFQDKKKYIAQNWGDKCNTKHLWDLVEEVLEEFNKLEDNLEWRQRVEAREWGYSDEYEKYQKESMSLKISSDGKMELDTETFIFPEEDEAVF